jgi:hypothetical protein
MCKKCVCRDLSIDTENEFVSYCILSTWVFSIVFIVFCQLWYFQSSFHIYKCFLALTFENFADARTINPLSAVWKRIHTCGDIKTQQRFGTLPGQVREFHFRTKKTMTSTIELRRRAEDRGFLREYHSGFRYWALRDAGEHDNKEHTHTMCTQIYRQIPV